MRVSGTTEQSTLIKLHPKHLSVLKRNGTRTAYVSTKNILL